MRARHAALALAAAATGAAAQQNVCNAAFASMGTSYDLSATHHTAAQGAYNVRDVRSYSTNYYFNPCDQVPNPDMTVCNSAGSNWTVATGWQIERPYTGNPSCYRLGGLASGGWNFTLFDDNYPDRGVVLTFLNGDGQWCPNSQPRTLSLEFTCDATINPASATYALGVSVREENTCDYRVQIPSLAGCPLECTTGGNLCNGHGVCGYNNDAQRTQCYCYNGWGGNRCDTGECAQWRRA